MKKILISLLSIIFIISMISSVYAATGSINSGASADTVIKGKTFTVTLAGTADSPIDGMYTKFTYDKNVLSLESASAGANYGNNSSDGEILVTNNSSSTSASSATLYTMTFKVLDNANVESTTISFSESELHLNVSGTVSSVSANIANVTVNIKADDTTAGNQGNNEEQTTPSNGDNSNTASNGSNGSGTEDKKENVTTSNKNTSTTSNKNTSSTSNKTTTTSKNTSKNKTTTKLPQTGAESTILFAIVALGAVSIVSYISYRKYNNI